VNVYLFQPQYPVAVRGRMNYWLPYSAGCIWSYVAQFEDIRANYQLKGLGYVREDLDSVIEQLVDPKVLGVSCYVWNEQYCLELARRVKDRWPDCWVVLGGANSHGELLRYKFLDSIVQAEGEAAFLDILRCLAQGRQPEPVYSKHRLTELSVPSPYLTGVFDQIIAARPDALWAMTFETNRGCPYACTFCDWGGTTYSKVKRFDLDRVRAELTWAKEHPVAYIVCADANFGIFKDRDIELAKVIRSVCEASIIDAVDINFAKNSPQVNYEIAQILGDYGRGITVSVQSMDPQVLTAIKRNNLKTNDIRELITLSEQTGVMTYTEMILGLPLETKETWYQGMTELLEVGQHQTIDMWLATVLRNSEMALASERSRYGIRTVWAKDYMSLGPDSLNDDIPEYAEIVTATNTMTQPELVDCYMYGWMIIHWHCVGYVQIIARYLRTVQGVGYRQFYDRLFDRIQTLEPFASHYQKLRQLVDHYLTMGYMTDEDKAWVCAGGHAFHSVSYQWMWEHRHEARQLAITVANELADCCQKLDLVQALSIYDSEHCLPQSVQLDWDYRTGNRGSYDYKITSRAPPNAILDFYAIRRKGLVKNQIEITDQLGETNKYLYDKELAQT
jgi:radical SAM superfamily enzyme YgiQ (UPF0313 family)